MPTPDTEVPQFGRRDFMDEPRSTSVGLATQRMITREKDTAGKVPPWAEIFSPEEWARFVAVLVADLESRHIAHRFDVEHGRVYVARTSLAWQPSTAAEEGVLELANVAQVCRARPRDAWGFAIRHHLDIVLAKTDRHTAEDLKRDWQLAREHVKLRLYERSSLPDIPLVTWEVARDLVAILAFDLPDTVNSVHLEDREPWDVSDDELYDIALSNVRGEGLLRATDVNVSEHATLRVLEGGHSFFAASHALFMEQYVHGDVGPHGLVLAVPHRHVVLYHSIRNAEAVRAMEAMIVSATTMYVDGPGSISSDLYWLPPRGDDSSLEDLEHRLVRLPCEIKRDTLRFVPPARFARMLASLG